jgi:hypothetical protein
MSPYAESKTIQILANYCTQHIHLYGFSDLYLIGRRAFGTPRPNGDHDFIAVASDSAPQSIITEGDLHDNIFQTFNAAREQAGLATIDLHIARQSYFRSQS